jgi:hypothetical protein
LLSTTLISFKPAFKLAYDIVTSSFYILGTNVSNHSKMDYDPYKSSYGRHVSGKWLDPPVVHVGHGVNKKFHYWTGIIEHLAPARYKIPEAGLNVEAPVVIKNNWVRAEEKMDETYLKYIIAEKHFGVKAAERALMLAGKAESFLNENDSHLIMNLFYRTLLTARIYEATATAYFGYRIYARGEEYQTKWLKRTMKRALDDMLVIADEIDSYRENVPRGQWDWRGDAATAREYHKKITETGWKEYGNVIFDPSPVSRDLP